MILLPEEFRRKGFDYKVIKRWDCTKTNKGIAILEQYQEDDLIAFEVIKIQKQLKDEPGPGGIIFKAKERVPSDEMWGTEGWTYGLFNDKDSAIKRATEKFHSLKKAILQIE